jgi:tRNA threonylcarbamoyladenosine biosynthesis protein TsaE
MSAAPAVSLASSSEEETRAIARRLAAELGGGDVIALTGPLGAGKTAFVRGLAEALGLAPGERVSSPSYALVNEYALAAAVRGAERLVHLDLYRLDGDDALEALGFSDFADLSDNGARAIVVIEWPEHAPYALAVASVTITIADRGGDERALTITRAAARSPAVAPPSTPGR